MVRHLQQLTIATECCAATFTVIEDLSVHTHMIIRAGDRMFLKDTADALQPILSHVKYAIKPVFSIVLTT